MLLQSIYQSEVFLTLTNAMRSPIYMDGLGFVTFITNPTPDGFVLGLVCLHIFCHFRSTDRQSDSIVCTRTMTWSLLHVLMGTVLILRGILNTCFIHSYKKD